MTTSCKCATGFIGQKCEDPLTKEVIDKLTKEFQNNIANLDPNAPLSADLIGNFPVYQDLLKADPSLITSDMANSIKDLVKNQLDLIENSGAKPMPQFLNVLDLSLFLAVNNNSTDFNNTSAVKDNEKLVNKYTDILVSSPSASNTSMLYQSDYLNVQISSSAQTDKDRTDSQSIAHNLSLINFQDCENLLRSTGVINKTDTIKFSKTDWSSALKTQQTNATSDMDSVSYSLYTGTGKKLDMNLCASTTTSISMHLNGLDKLNISKITDYNPYDLESPFYTDICMPIPINQTAATLDEKRKTFNSLGFICSAGCQFKSINIETGYLNCKCNSSNTDAHAPEYGEIFATVLNSTNIDIVKCYKVFLSMVIIIFNFNSLNSYQT